jgi:hypothetical protein
MPSSNKVLRRPHACLLIAITRETKTRGTKIIGSHFSRL